MGASEVSQSEPLAAPQRRRRRWIRRTFRIVLVLALLYVAGGGLLFVLQSFLIFPGAQSRGARWAIVSPGAGQQLVKLETRRGEHVVALYSAARGPGGHTRADASACPTVLYFYGNGQCIAHAPEAQAFCDQGFNVLVPDYVGYGMSDGRPSDDAVYRTAEAAYAYLTGPGRVDPARLVVAGRSLGGAAAIDVASRHRVAGLATFSAFTTLSEVCQKVVPWFPTRWLVRYRMDNLVGIAKVTCPAWIAHGDADSLIPPEMADRLAAAAVHAQRVHVPGANHNDLFEVGDGALLDQFAAFVQQATRTPSTAR